MEWTGIEYINLIHLIIMNFNFKNEYLMKHVYIEVNQIKN